jgi:hypothetical protein
MTIATKIRWIINIIAFFTVGLYGFLKIKEIPFGIMTSSDYSEILIKISLIILFTSWTTGSRFDTSLQEKYLDKSLQSSDFPVVGAIFIFILVIVFLVILYISDIYQLILFLTAFWTIDLLAWLYFSKVFIAKKFSFKVKELDREIHFLINELQEYNDAILKGCEDHMKSQVFEEKKSMLESDLEKKGAEYFQLELVDNHARGNWRLKRHLFGFFILISIIIAYFLIDQEIIQRINSIKTKKGLMVSLIFMFVLYNTIWIWMKRYEVYIKINFINDFWDTSR